MTSNIRLCKLGNKIVAKLFRFDWMKAFQKLEFDRIIWIRREDWSDLTVLRQMKWWRNFCSRYFEQFFPYTENSIKGKSNRRRHRQPQKENRFYQIKVFINETRQLVCENISSGTSSLKKWQTVWENQSSGTSFLIRRQIVWRKSSSWIRSDRLSGKNTQTKKFLLFSLSEKFIFLCFLLMSQLSIRKTSI